jgi:hypothetical protein
VQICLRWVNSQDPHCRVLELTLYYAIH